MDFQTFNNAIRHIEAEREGAAYELRVSTPSGIFVGAWGALDGRSIFLATTAGTIVVALAAISALQAL